jgi:hypothetical protein
MEGNVWLVSLWFVDLRERGLDLEVMSAVLNTKWAWNLRNVDEKPWRSLTPPVDNVSRDIFDIAAEVELGDGTRCYFWLDRWLKGKTIEKIAMEVYEAVNPTIIAKCNWVDNIKKPIFIQVFMQVLSIWEDVTSSPLSPGVEDTWTVGLGLGKLVASFLQNQCTMPSSP